MTIRVNGQIIQIEENTAYAIRDRLFSKEAVVILNGFQISEDYPITGEDELFIFVRGVLPAQDQLEAMIAARHTPKIHSKLKKAKVAIAGLGGLGSNIAVNLARIGAGSLFLVDFDVVEPSNLNRQSYYLRHLGMHKTEALKEQIEQINPFVQVNTKTVRVEQENVVELFEDYDVLCEAFDNPAAKAMLVTTALSQLPNIKVVAASGMAGYASSNHICTERKMKNLYVCGDYESGARIGDGLMAPRVQICAGHQANMVLRLLLGIEEV